MYSALLKTIVFASLYYVCEGYSPPRVEKQPLLLDSYLPASMQIIAHLTDLMKYELRPGGLTTTTTTVRPTPPHKPAIYAPDVPLGPEAYFARRNPYFDYSQKLGSHDGLHSFDRFRFPVHDDEVEGRSASWTPSEEELKSIADIFSQLQADPSDHQREQKSLEENNATTRTAKALTSVNIKDLDLFGENLLALYIEANRIDEKNIEDETERTINFLKSYDDSTFSLKLLTQKRIPPTKAYVTLLSLYDLLNKESKKLGLNKYGGYSESILKALIDTSSGSSAEQLKLVFTKIVQRKDTSDSEILKRINALLSDMETSTSYLNDALRYIPPLQFDS